MKYMQRIFFFAILCALCTVSLAFAVASSTVTKVYDGDTVLLQDGRVVRIAFIDTPEMNYKQKSPQYYAEQAKKILSEMVLGKEIVLMQHITTDRYGRHVAIITTLDGKDIGAILLQRGAAYVYPIGKSHRSYIAKLVTIQQNAIAQKQGAWNAMVPYFTEQGAVVGNKRSKRFFSANYSELHTISKNNRIHFDSAVNAFIGGYSPARNCSIWPKNGRMPSSARTQ